ncbi:hypothetical protein DFO53_2579 [Enterobacter sp. AG5470]|nr:hypothetical protein DFO53_2579 [Enterobacter sp. AG5470]
MRTGVKRAWRRGICLACRPLLISFSHRYTSVEDLLKRESQLLHKYDEQTAHPESFQRISKLSGIRTQVKCRAYLYKKVLNMN